MATVSTTIDDCGRRADQVLSVLACAQSAEYIGEPISQLEHALQAGYWAQEARQEPVVILAALLHDIGHLIDPDAPTMDALGTIDHEALGAAYLTQLGGSDVLAHLVRSHVQAKRYLCYRKQSYFEQLSPASRGTLQWQGGPMSLSEAKAFEEDPWFDVILRMRIFDERAKEPNFAVPGLDHYRPLLIEHLAQEEPQKGTAC